MRRSEREVPVRGRVDVTSSRRGVARHAAVAVLAWALAGCSHHRPPPAPGESTGAVPDLTGRAVMVFPVQALVGLPGDADAELAFALQSGGGSAVNWILPPELRKAVEGSPSLDVRLEGLPVGMFLQAEVERVGDPLYGVIRRLGALTGAQVALIPVMVRYLPPVAGQDGQGMAEVVAALLDVRSGYVLWFGVEGGDTGAASEPGVLASAVDALARRLTGPRRDVL